MENHGYEIVRDTKGQGTNQTDADSRAEIMAAQERERQREWQSNIGKLFTKPLGSLWYAHWLCGFFSRRARKS